MPFRVLKGWKIIFAERNERNNLKKNNDFFSSISDTGNLKEKKSEFSQQEFNLRPSGY